MNILKERKKEIIDETTQPVYKKREVIWDIVKGIGIISIVIGHTSPIATMHEFVYMYHLAIFYFVAAYFFNEKKYGDQPFAHVGQRLKGTWTKYVFYSVILILLRNIFVEYNFYASNITKYQNFDQIIVAILDTMTFSCYELFASALWFVPTIILALGLFGGMIYIARKSSKSISDKITVNNENKEKIIKYIIILFLTILYGILGVYLNKNQLSLKYHIHTVFLVIPICTMGYFVKEYIVKIRKIKKWYITIPTFILTTVILLYLIIEKGMKIELSRENIINGYMFYIVSFIGICFCLSLASIIEKIPVVNKVIELCGKHSFAIMALHFACGKGVDVIYSKIINETNPEIISKWVTSYPEKLWIVYVIVGCLVPLIFSIIVEYIKKICRKGNENG